MVHGTFDHIIDRGQHNGSEVTSLRSWVQISALLCVDFEFCPWLHVIFSHSQKDKAVKWAKNVHVIMNINVAVPVHPKTYLQGIS